MTTFQKLIDEYLKSSDKHTMEHLTHKIDNFVEEVRETHPELVKKFLCWIDLELNPHFTKETAEYAVSKMKNKDGSTGEHWSYAVAEKALYSKEYDFNEADWYYVLNMVYSDYYKSGKSDDVYIELACDFLSDADAPEDKAKRYYLAMQH